MSLVSLARPPAPGGLQSPLFGLATILALALSLLFTPTAHATRVGHPVTGTQVGTLDGASRDAFPKWSGVMARMASWPASGTPSCSEEGGQSCELSRWWSLLETLGNESAAVRIERVNRFINRVRYLPDSGNWGALDYWAAPDEFFDRGGDCEDYAIAKYYSLKLMGFPADAMRIVVLNDKRLRIAHAVLEVRLGGRAYLLDNRYEQILTWDKVAHYRAIYSVNEANYWVHTGDQIGADWEEQTTAAGSAAH